MSEHGPQWSGIYNSVCPQNCEKGFTFRFWARSVRPNSVPTDQSETFQSCRFSPKLIQSWTFQSQNNSVPDTSVPQQFSPKEFSPKTLQSQNFQSKYFQSQTVQSQNNSVPIQHSPWNFSLKTIQSRTDQSQINLCFKLRRQYLRYWTLGRLGCW